MVKYTLPLRYLLPIFLFLATMLTVDFVTGQRQIINAAKNQVTASFEENLYLSQHLLEEMLSQNDYDSIYSYIEALGRVKWNRQSILIGTDNKVIASSQADFIGRRWGDIYEATSNGFLQSLDPNIEKRITFINSDDFVFGFIKVCGSSRSIDPIGKCGFFYQLLDTRSAIVAAKEAAISQMLWVGSWGVLSVVILFLIFYNLITRRSAYITDVIHRFSRGENDARIHMKGSDELASLSRSIDEMFTQIDINQKKEHETAATLSRAQHIAHLGNWVWDINAGKLSWSDEIFRIFGWEPQSFEPDYERFMNVIHPEDREKVQDAVAQAIGDHTTEYRVDHRVVLDDKTIRYVQENGRVSYDSKGKAVAMLGTVLDITERIKTEEELELFQLMIEKTSDPIFLIDVDDDFRMAYVNEASVRHFGASREEILTWRIPDWNPNFSYEDLPAHRAAMISQPGMTVETLHIVKGGLTIPVEISLNPIRYRGRNCHFGYFKDITERKEVEKNLNQAKEQAEETTRVKSEFLANMSHEIRTPMNAIINLSYLAQEDEGLPTTTRDYLYKIESSANNLLGIINDILDFSKIEAGKLSLERTPFSLYAMIDSLTSVVDCRDKNIDVWFRVEPGVPDHLNGDVLRITQVLTNLLSNAVKFTDDGEVVLSVSASPEVDGHTGLVFDVSDSGRGISEEEQLHLFKPFTQADSSISRKYGGTGLGLVITQRLVEMMGGTIFAESRKGQGSHFVVSIELEVDKYAPIDTKADNYPDVTGLRILIANNNKVARDIFKERLTPLDVSVVTVASSEELYSKLNQCNMAAGHPFDAVILDWGLDSIDVIEVSRIIKHEMKLEFIPKLMLCMPYGAGAALDDADQQIIDSILRRPFGPDMLIQSIVNMMGYEAAPKRGSLSSLPAIMIEELAQRKGASILVVDDNEINLEIARQLLLRVDMQVTVVSLASEAFKLLDEKAFDLVLMDIQMPEMDGLEATRYIRDLGRFDDLPIVAMTAHAMDSDRKVSIDAGMNDHLTKPINVLELYSALCQWISVGGSERLALSEPDSIVRVDGSVKIEKLPGVSIQSGIDRLRGNTALFYQLLLKFSQRNKHSLDDIDKAIDVRSYDKAAELVHAVKGVAGNLGVDGLFQLSKELELELIKGVGGDRLNSVLQDFKLEFDKVMAGLLVLDEKDDSKRSHGLSFDAELILHLLNDLKQLIDSDLGMALDISTKLEALMLGTVLEGDYVPLEQALSNFELDAAKECVFVMQLHIDKIQQNG